MVARGQKIIPWALLTVALFLSWASLAGAWDQKYRYPVKVRTSGSGFSSAYGGVGGWESAAGASREILCPKRTYDLALGLRPFFGTLSGMSRAVSKGGEGTFLGFSGHLRMPSENTLWEFYSHLRLWEKVALRLEYLPWYWSGTGHSATKGNFAGLLLQPDDAIEASLNLTTFLMGADYDVAFNRDLLFGPNADFHIIRWNQRVAKSNGESVDFSQTILQPAIGAHIRYEPSNTGFFSWYKPYLEGRFSWMSFNGLGLSTCDLGAGIAPPVSRNVDAGMKLGYKQWKLDGSRSRLAVDADVEGLYLDLSLRF